ncbi:methyltransferase domain-containing protein [Streptomyces sp. NPDC051940]|uniref:SAM-dependent methyltransferase n=1 Tax=Streptomyces sp. NPDC051940 TaxID=3155675 RepID=UPI003413ACA6
MTTDDDELLRPARYPRSAAYDPAWLLRLDMGPHPLWLLEDLARDLRLLPGMRVLDLGSGKGASSVFLVREFGVEVVAADWWVAAEEARAVFAEAGVEDRVTAVRAEAHQLPFEAESFDAIVSIDAFEYFGTADGYLPYLQRFLRPGGQLGIATPALRREVRELGSVPEHIRQVVGWEAVAWHTPEWWRFQWEVTELVDVTAARMQEHGWDDWLRWSRACGDDAVTRMLLEDGGELLGFALVAARKR